MVFKHFLFLNSYHQKYDLEDQFCFIEHGTFAGDNLLTNSMEQQFHCFIKQVEQSLTKLQIYKTINLFSEKDSLLLHKCCKSCRFLFMMFGLFSLRVVFLIQQNIMNIKCTDSINFFLLFYRTKLFLIDITLMNIKCTDSLNFFLLFYRTELYLIDITLLL